MIGDDAAVNVTQHLSVGELAGTLQSFKRPTRRSPPSNCSLTLPIILNFHLWVGRVTPNASSPVIIIRMRSCFNPTFFFIVCLKGPQGQLIRVLVSECDNFDDFDVTSYSHVTSSMTSPIDAP